MFSKRLNNGLNRDLIQKIASYLSKQDLAKLSAANSVLRADLVKQAAHAKQEFIKEGEALVAIEREQDAKAEVLSQNRQCPRGPKRRRFR